MSVLAIAAQRRIKLIPRNRRGIVIDSYPYQNVHFMVVALRSFRAFLATFLVRFLLIFWITLPAILRLLLRLQFRSLSGLFFWLFFRLFVA